MTPVRTAEALPTRVDRYDLRLPRGEMLRLGGDRRALVMGILNVTPDSFSDGGLFADADAAVAHGESMASEGADLIDIGGESTRPGALPVPVDEQLSRVTPVIRRLAGRIRIPISIDTTSAEVARRALEAGAQIINDVSALREDPAMAPLVADSGAPVILMHMLGRPRNMQINPAYRDVVGEVVEFLRERMAFAVAQGIDAEQIIVDPGFGFGKTLAHNLELLRGLEALQALNRPVMVGTSRKAMLGHITGAAPQDRAFGTAATVAAAVERGAVLVRVHDARAAVHVVKVMAAIHGKAWTCT